MTNDKKATGRVASVCYKIKYHFNTLPRDLVCIVVADIGVAALALLACTGGVK